MTERTARYGRIDRLDVHAGHGSVGDHVSGTSVDEHAPDKRRVDAEGLTVCGEAVGTLEVGLVVPPLLKVRGAADREADELNLDTGSRRNQQGVVAVGVRLGERQVAEGTARYG